MVNWQESDATHPPPSQHHACETAELQSKKVARGKGKKKKPDKTSYQEGGMVSLDEDGDPPGFQPLTQKVVC